MLPDLSLLDSDLSSLLRLLQRSRGFSLVVVLVDTDADRAAFLEQLWSGHRVDFAILACEEPSFDPLPEIRKKIPHLPPQSAFILTGMELWMNKDRAEFEPFWANLNQAREELRQTLPCPLILALPSFLYAEAVRAAPDLFSGSSLLLHFWPGTEYPLYPMLWLRYPAFAGLSLKDKRAQLRFLRRADSPGARDQLAELEIRWWLGHRAQARSLLPIAMDRSQSEKETHRCLLMVMDCHKSNPKKIYDWYLKLRNTFAQRADTDAEYGVSRRVFELQRDWGNREAATTLLSLLTDLASNRSEEDKNQIELYGAILALDRSEWQDAENRLLSVLNRRLVSYGESHPFTLEVRFTIVCAIHAQGRVSEARALLAEIEDKWKLMVPARHTASRRIQAMHRILHAKGRPRWPNSSSFLP